MLYNANRDSKKDPEGKGWDDFYPQHKKGRRAAQEQGDDEMFMAMQMWAMMANRRSAKA